MQELASDTERTLRFYFSDIAASEPLSREEEVRLSARIKKGDIAARDQLVQANLNFVIHIAKKYQRAGLPFADLISAGNLGLLTAARHFDGSKGFKFISYAVWWVRQSIHEAINTHNRTVRIPTNKLHLLRDINTASKRLGQELAREPAVEELSEELDISAQEIRDALCSTQMVRSLDEPLSQDDERDLLGLLADTVQTLPDAEVLQTSKKEHIGRLLEHLDARERRVIRLSYGLDGDKSFTLEYIGRQLGITRERVRQIQKKAFNKLRRALTTQESLELVRDY